MLATAAIAEQERLPCMRIVADYGTGWRARWRRWRRRPVSHVLCGLWWRHAGECVPFVPGEYLRAPLVDPLALWRATSPRRWAVWRCPEGCLLNSVSTEGQIHDMVFEDGGWVLHDVVVEWRFSPCGHTFRDIVEPVNGDRATM